MPPKVASIFGGGSSRPAKPVVARPVVTIELSKDEGDFEKILSEQRAKADTSKPKFIYAAAEKAKERRALDEALKEKRYEREIEKLEREHGPLLRFDSKAPGQETVQEKEPSFPVSEKEAEVKIEDISGLDEMRERYLKRVEVKDILKLNVSESQMNLIVNWVALSKA